MNHVKGSFATVEMRPAKPGLWQLDTEVAEYQQAGMQAIFNIANAGKEKYRMEIIR